MVAMAKPVIIVTNYLADVQRPKESHAKYELNPFKDKLAIAI